MNLTRKFRALNTTLTLLFLLLGNVYGSSLRKSPQDIRNVAEYLRPSKNSWIRFENPIENINLDPMGRHMSFIERVKGEPVLKVMDIATKGIKTVSKSYHIAKGHVWAPGGGRLLYIRGASYGKEQKIRNELMLFEPRNSRSHILATYPHRVGFLNFDPRDFQLLILHKNGIHRKKLNFPTKRLAAWQYMNTQKEGRYLATEKGVFWLSNNGISMRKLKDIGNKLQHFEVSPDGRSVVWSTTADHIYFSRDGEPSKLLDYGKDPTWHPKQPIVLYSGARRIGKRSYSYDLKISDTSGKQKWLSASQYSKERWPKFFGTKNLQIVYTIENTTDIFLNSNNLF